MDKAISVPVLISFEVLLVIFIGFISRGLGLKPRVQKILNILFKLPSTLSAAALLPCGALQRGRGFGNNFLIFY